MAHSVTTTFVYSELIPIKATRRTVKQPKVLMELDETTGDPIRVTEYWQYEELTQITQRVFTEINMAISLPSFQIVWPTVKASNFVYFTKPSDILSTDIEKFPNHPPPNDIQQHSDWVLTSFKYSLLGDNENKYVAITAVLRLKTKNKKITSMTRKEVIDLSSLPDIGTV